MTPFARLYHELDATNSRDAKTGALERFFKESDARDSAWGLAMFLGRRIRRAISSTELKSHAAHVTGLPAWLIDECHEAVGDLGETLALLLPKPAHGREIPLAELVEQRIVPMRRMSEAARAECLRETWDSLEAPERLVFHKLLSGTFRVGASATLAIRALANVVGISQAEMHARVMGDWEPTPEFFRSITSKDPGAASPAQPYPFLLARQISPNDERDGLETSLGDIGDWQVEWKWDGIRSQIVRRQGRVWLWSRGEEVVSDRFPEIVAAADDLPDGTVLDGEILAWEGQQPLPFGQLQTRINKLQRNGVLFADVPVRFVAYDLLEHQGVDRRADPISDRRRELEAVIAACGLPLSVSPLVIAPSWKALRAVRQEARARGVEGLMLKRRSSPYGVGRTGGDWWKWKSDPYHIDAVLIGAQRGHGRRANLFTDYTFGVWLGKPGDGELVPVAKAYSGLTDDEIDKVDRFVRENTTGRFGPVSAVKPELVFELAFEAIQPSTRHKAGLALRFPRMARWRDDKRPGDADTIDVLAAMMPREVSTHLSSKRRAHA